jgi:hypothetical protein
MNGYSTIAITGCNKGSVLLCTRSGRGSHTIIVEAAVQSETAPPELRI